MIRKVLSRCLVLALAAALLAAPLAGCGILRGGNSGPPVGALDNFDAHVYYSLLTAQAVVDAAKMEFIAGNLKPGAKSAINTGCGVLNIIGESWRAYRLFKGQPEAARQAAQLRNEIAAQMPGLMVAADVGWAERVETVIRIAASAGVAMLAEAGLPIAPEKIRRCEPLA